MEAVIMHRDKRESKLGSLIPKWISQIVNFHFKFLKKSYVIDLLLRKRISP